jgi:hypothetical protein
MTNTSLRLTRGQLKTFLKVEAVCVLALCIAAVVAAGLAYLQAVITTGNAFFSPIQTADVMGVSVVYFGLVPTVLLGAPIYTLLKTYSLDSWAAVLITGLLPGVVVLLFSLPIGIYAIVCGGIIASVTHAYFRNKKI